MKNTPFNRAHSTTNSIALEQLEPITTPSCNLETSVTAPIGEGASEKGGLRTKGILKNNNSEISLVTVITVVYNGSRYLEKTISSVLNQSWGNVECIVIDGGSTDGTLDILRMYDNEIDYWVSEQDSGIYDAMNKGLSKAVGEWVIFMNSGDCFYGSDALELFMRASNCNASLLYSDYLRPKQGRRGGLEYQASRPLIGNGGIVRMICHQAILFNKKHFPGFYDCTYQLCADLDVLLRLRAINSTKFIHIPKPLVVYCGGGASEKNYNLLHKERELIIGRHLKWRYLFINKLNHIRARLFSI